MLPIAFLVAAPSAFAQVSCSDVQNCVASAFEVCSQNTTCAKTDRLATTSTDLSDRAIARARCSRASTRARCNVCYQLAKIPLRSRFDRSVFHGILGQAIKNIEQERKDVCPTRGHSSSSSSSSSGTSTSSSSNSSSSSSNSLSSSSSSSS